MADTRSPSAGAERTALDAAQLRPLIGASPHRNPRTWSATMADDRPDHPDRPDRPATDRDPGTIDGAEQVRTITATPIRAVPRCELAESPRWDGANWWWVDAPAGLVYSAGPSVAEGVADRLAGRGEGVRRCAIGGRVSMVHPATGDRILVADGTELRLHDRGSPTTAGELFASLDLPGGWLLNDGAADPLGGLWIGVVHPDRSAELGYLQRLSPDGAPDVRIEGVALSNGVAFDSSGTTMYHADSLARTVTAHRLDRDGHVVGSKPFVYWADDQGLPDGLATDLDGGLWVAAYGAGQVRRYLASGELDLVISVPTPQVTSIAIGGPDGRQALITTAREGYDDRRSAAEPLAGCLFRAVVPHRGRPTAELRPRIVGAD